MLPPAYQRSSCCSIIHPAILKFGYLGAAAVQDFTATHMLHLQPLAVEHYSHQFLLLSALLLSKTVLPPNLLCLSLQYLGLNHIYAVQD